MKINDIRLFLQGKKTYIVTAIAVVYVLGSYLGWWVFNGQILALFGFSSVATLAAKMERLLSDPEDEQVKPPTSCGAATGIIALICIGFAFGVVGCKTHQLEVGGAYALTSAQPDGAEYDVDCAFNLAESSIDAAFRIERDNRKMLFSLNPNIKHTLDLIRPMAWRVVKSYTAAHVAYEANPTKENLTDLQVWLSKMTQLSEAAQAVIKINE